MVKQETEFKIYAISAELEPFLYYTERIVEEKMARKSCIQLNYLLCVKAEDKINPATITFDPEKHSAGIWADKEEIGHLDMTGEMRGVVSDASEIINKEMHSGGYSRSNSGAGVIIAASSMSGGFH